jgi:hypothetical protein
VKRLFTLVEPIKEQLDLLAIKRVTCSHRVVTGNIAGHLSSQGVRFVTDGQCVDCVTEGIDIGRATEGGRH